MPMTVSCTSCSTAFPVDPAKVPPGGVRARCSACGSIFRVERPTEPSEPAPRSVEADEAPTAGASAAREDESGSAQATPTAEAEATATGDEGVSMDEGAAPGSEATGGAAPFGTSEGAAYGSVDDWVLETEPEVDVTGLDRVQRLDTVEEGMRKGQDALSGPGAETTPAAGEAPVPGAPEAGGAGTAFTPEAPAPAPGSPGESDAITPSAPVQGFTFGRRDPQEKASRLARVLVSDMVTYNQERHQRALSQGTLQEDFEDEIKKSWEEYVEQVGQEVAEGTTFFNDALNEILARGQQVF